MDFNYTKVPLHILSLDVIIRQSLLVMGVFVSMPIVTIRILGAELSVFQTLFLWTTTLLIAYNIQNGVLTIRKTEKALMLWLALSLISCLAGWLYFGLNSATAGFAQNAKSYIPKVLMYMMFLMLLSKRHKLPWIESLVKGVLIGCLANLIWSIIDAAGYYLIGKSINNIIFYSYAVAHNIHFDSISIIQGGMIRASGFNYDPAHLGFISPFILSYGINKHRLALVILATLGIVASASTTALVCSALVILLDADFHKMKVGSKMMVIKKKRLIILLVGVMVTLAFVITFSDRLSLFLQSATTNFLGRVSDTYLNNLGRNLRWLYIKHFPKALVNIGAFMFFGTGFGTASYGYVIDPSILAAIGHSNNFAYDMENTYLAYILDTGIVGAALFFRFVATERGRLKEMREGDRTASILYSLFTVTLLSMLFYHYILFGIQMIGLIAGALYISNLTQDEQQ